MVPFVAGWRDDALVRGVSGSVMVGRQAELDRLVSAFDLVQRTARPRVVLVAGEAGVGKTRLLVELAASVEAAGSRVVLGRCIDGGDEILPLAALRHIVLALVDTLEPAVLQHVLGPARPGLAVLVPELGDARGGPLAGDVGQLALGVVRRLARLGPVLVAVEDLHWADHSTRSLFSLLASTEWLGPVLVVGTYRNDELHRRHPLLPVLAGVARTGRHERIDLAGLSEADVASMVAALGGRDDPATVASITARSGGLPFFVEELVAAMAAGTGDRPDTLRDAVLARVAHLGDDAWEVLAVVAAAGLVSSSVARDACGTDDVRLGAIVDGLRSTGLVVSDRDGLRFRHELAREVVYDELGPVWRPSVHARLAAGLERREPDQPGTIARHWQLAHDLPRALGASLAAGRQFLAAGAAGEALQSLERALEFWDRVPGAASLTGVDRPGVLLLASTAAKHAHRLDIAVTLARTAARELAMVDRERAGEAWLHLQGLYPAGAHRPERVDAVQRALALIPASPPSAGRARALAYASIVAVHARDGPTAARYGREAAATAAHVADPEATVAAEMAMSGVSWLLGDAGELAHARAAVEHCCGEVTTETAVVAHSTLASALLATGRLDDAVEVLRSGADLSQRHGLSAGPGGWVTGILMHVLMDLGRWHEADQVADEHRTLLGGDIDRGAPVRARLRVRQGRLDEARPLVDRMRHVLADGYTGAGVTEIVAAVLELDSAERRLDDVVPTFERLTHLPHLPSGFGYPIGLAVRALADGLEGAPAGAVGARADLVSIATGWIGVVEHSDPDGHLSGRLGALELDLARAELSRLRGDPRPALWESSAEGWRGVGMPYHEAYACFRGAEAHLMGIGGRAVAARHAAAPLAARALAIATRLGGSSLEQAVAALVCRGHLSVREPAGAPPDPPPNPLGLTHRETEVLALLAEGRTNGEIAARLYISTKTASVHVSNILRKLGVANRVEAAAVFHRIGTR